VICLNGLSAQEKGSKKDSAKDKGIHGTVVKADSVDNTITIKTDEGKERTFTVGSTTKLVGPRGGAVRRGLEDKRFKQEGLEVTIFADSTGKIAKEVHLGTSPRSGAGSKKGPGDSKGGGGDEKKPAKP
jgi:hypothetical protein